ncbi:MAG TPA: hypothetical protein VNJ01_13695 [Bacteriovoracaceae bacterium]|nr:hypothetical protein [Bacteriovoracaceae bacterium]
MRQLFGYIFDWGESREGEFSFLEALQAAKLREIRAYDGPSETVSRRWVVIYFISRRPLLGEEPGALDAIHEFRYRLYVRVNTVTGSVILAASRYAITDAAIEVINRGVTPDLRRRVININEVVQHLFRRDVQQYAVTYLMADVPGYRPLVNTIAIHGEDIGTSNFLLEERQAFTARQLGVRAIRSRIECGRFGNSGSIQFNLDNSEALEKFLAYTYKNKFYIA